MRIKFHVAIMLAVLVPFITGCPSPTDEDETDNDTGPLGEIEIDASAIYDGETTGIIVDVWNNGYTSPVDNAT